MENNIDNSRINVIYFSTLTKDLNLALGRLLKIYDRCRKSMLNSGSDDYLNDVRKLGESGINDWFYCETMKLHAIGNKSSKLMHDYYVNNVDHCDEFIDLINKVNSMY